MQGKVSIVMPCYNKEDYIAPTLRSVCNQVWDNIELILVNDGSTDRTREIISEWEPKLRARGYEVVIIDRENGGCCAAVHSGILRMTGDYFCLLDSDDELRPEYCSRMAGWLDNHADYDWTACHFEIVTDDGVGRVRSFTPSAVSLETPKLLENWLLWRTTAMVWIYMSRVSYMRRCGLPDVFYNDRSVTYEPCVAIPLAAGRGKLKFFNEPLYIYNKFASDLSAFPVFEKVLSYYREYLRLSEWTLSRLTVSEQERRRYIFLARLVYYARIISYSHVPDSEKHQRTMAEGMSGLLDEMLTPVPRISAERILSVGLGRFFWRLRYKLLDLGNGFEAKVIDKKRIIGYGALGKYGRIMLPALAATPFRPDVIWDGAAGKDGEIDGIPVFQPDFESLSEEDAVIIFPRKRAVLDEIEPRLTACKTGVILKSEDFDEYFSLSSEFPELDVARLSEI